MFEQEQRIVDRLLAESAAFKKLHDKHQDLKKRIDKAQRGKAALVEERRLEDMKKQKLRLKDQMARMIADCKKKP